MKYYKLTYNFENDNNFIGCTVSKELNLNQYVVCEGKRVNEWDDGITFDFNPEEGSKKSDYLANSYGLLIFSDKFRNKMSYLVNENIQYLDINIRNIKNNTKLKGYKVANVIITLDALDLEHSKYDLFELEDKKILSVEKYALKKDEVKNCNIFKLKGDTIPTFVSEQFKSMVEENDLTGFQFLEVSIV